MSSVEIDQGRAAMRCPRGMCGVTIAHFLIVAVTSKLIGSLLREGLRRSH